MDPQTNRGQRLASGQSTRGAAVGRVGPPPARASGMVRPADRSTRWTVARWQRPTPGVFVAAHRSRSMTSCSVSGSASCTPGAGAVLSHLTAARRGGLHWVGRDVIDVLTPKGDAGGAARRLLLPPDAPAVRAVGQAGQRTAAAARSSTPRSSPRSGTATYDAPSGCWPPACSRASPRRPVSGRPIPHDPQAAPRQDLRGSCSATSPAAPSRSPRSTSGSLCAETGLTPPRPAGRTPGQGGPPALPRLRVDPGRRPGRRAGGRRLVPRRGT